MRLLFAAMAFALLLALAGCGGKKVDKTPLKMEEVPAEIQKVAKDNHPEVNFTEAYKEGPNYELRGKNKAGKLIEIDITPEGKVVKD